ncbi:hypothetical protein [Endozoicomonas euniceicola]|uniref:Uncharacterized protein n=1 Tax=Endozoicomonas euniceicola TaxID=1234143 RepID=A0ABY6GQB6_9GAMM|nr:hypothetical protein [Endozoicomonas euniceicola]UYM14945.1 hypothetical protein NX720_18930 [Endozoicomonas euniceicola]
MTRCKALIKPIKNWIILLSILLFSQFSVGSFIYIEGDESKLTFEGKVTNTCKHILVYSPYKSFSFEIRSLDTHAGEQLLFINRNKNGIGVILSFDNPLPPEMLPMHFDTVHNEYKNEEDNASLVTAPRLIRRGF